MKRLLADEISRDSGKNGCSQSEGRAIQKNFTGSQNLKSANLISLLLILMAWFWILAGWDSDSLFAHPATDNNFCKAIFVDGRHKAWG